MQQLNEIRARNKVRIKTKINKKDVLGIDNFPTDKQQQQVYKYYCPICMRYFNNILVSSCCENYVCRHCIGDMARRAKTDVKYVINCSHCLSYEFKLHDVDKSAKVKIYTDTPFKYMPSLQSAAKESKVDMSREECIPFTHENITVMRVADSPSCRNTSPRVKKESGSETGTRLQSQPGHIEEEESPINEPECTLREKYLSEAKACNMRKKNLFDLNSQSNKGLPSVR